MRWGKRKGGSAAAECEDEESLRVDQHATGKRDVTAAGRDITSNDNRTINDRPIIVNVHAGSAALPVTAEVAELAGLLSGIPEALAIIHQVFERTPAIPSLDATAEQLLAKLQRLVPLPGAMPYLRQVSELAAQHAAHDPDRRKALAAYGERLEIEEDATSAPSAPPPRVTKKTVEPSGDPCLLVVINQNYYDPESFWLELVLYRNKNDGEPIKCDNKYVSIKAIKEQLRTLLPTIVNTCRALPLIEFAVPDKLLGKDFDQWLIPSRPESRRHEDYRLGEKYRVVVRDLDRMVPGQLSTADHDMWESRWNLLLTCNDRSRKILRLIDPQAGPTFTSLRASLWRDTHGSVVLALLPMYAAARGRGDKLVKELLNAGFQAGVPAAIWLRRGHATGPSVEDDRTYLMDAMKLVELKSLPESVRKLRLQAEEDQELLTHPGRRLSLLWADPKRSWAPPDLALPQTSTNGDER